MSLSSLASTDGAVVGALRYPTYEVIPLRGAEEAVAGHVDPAETVRFTVTASASFGLNRTIELAGRLTGWGFRAVPHLAARQVTDRSHLADLVAELSERDIREVFVIGGDAREPAGTFTSASELLGALAELGVPFDEVGVAGYPESHPVISDDDLARALVDKQGYATYVVSQMCFDPAPVRTWVRAIRERGITLPVEIGVPGVAPLTKLLRISARIGVGESARFLRSHRGFLKSVATPGPYRPDALLAGLETELTDPASGVRGFHIYTFNELERTEEWRHGLLAELGSAVA